MPRKIVPNPRCPLPGKIDLSTFWEDVTPSVIFKEKSAKLKGMLKSSGVNFPSNIRLSELPLSPPRVLKAILSN